MSIRKPFSAGAVRPAVQVIATTIEGTSAALEMAVPLAAGSNARLVVIVPHLVSYPIEAATPIESTRLFAKRYEELAERLGAQARVEVVLCRRLEHLVDQLIDRDATIVIGGPVGRWITSPEERFANLVSSRGRRVILVASGPNTSQRRAAPSAAAAALFTFLAVLGVPHIVRAQATQPSSAEMMRRIEALEAQLAELRAQLQAATADRAKPAAEPAEATPSQAGSGPVDAFVVGVSLDTYYSYNFNRPIGRVDLLRAYDVTSNNFTLNQASLIVERAPDVENGRRFGGRVDLQYGQATETLQGSLANEPRPWVYRNIFQAYGTYIALVGSGLTVDFGKWASALGYENNYTKDQANYSRSYWFNFLPFYHTGARVKYQASDRIGLNYWVTNGTQQTEAFNNFKDQYFGVTLQPAKSVSWNVAYYLGQEHPDVQAIQTPGPPSSPTQPGLSIVPVDPYYRGKLHIFDSYATWQASPDTTLGVEADYVISRNPSPTPDNRVSGGALYARHRLTRKTALAGRVEYLRDNGGQFSGITQRLKEVTATYDYRFDDGFLVRGEWRRDWSDTPFFLTRRVNELATAQDTVILGAIWWWGTKQGAW